MMEVDTVSPREEGKEATALETETETEAEVNRSAGLGVELGNGGLILVLFEMPSGFAIFTYDGVNLWLPRAIENIWADFLEGYMAKSVVWLKKFKTFDDKASAINLVTSVNEQLATMIRERIVPGQKLAVGNLEYKKIIEENLLMWGLKNCMHYLVPEEKLELTKEDRLHMSEGMKIVLDGYKLKVEPEMVNEHIIETAGIVYGSDHCVNKHSESLRAADEHLKKISDIDSQHWGLVKLGTALMVLCNLQDELPPGDPLEVFSKDDYFKLVNHGPQYQGKIFKASLKVVYEEML